MMIIGQYLLYIGKPYQRYIQHNRTLYRKVLFLLWRKVPINKHKYSNY